MSFRRQLNAFCSILIVHLPGLIGFYGSIRECRRACLSNGSISFQFRRPSPGGVGCSRCLAVNQWCLFALTTEPPLLYTNWHYVTYGSLRCTDHNVRGFTSTAGSQMHYVGLYAESFFHRKLTTILLNTDANQKSEKVQALYKHARYQIYRYNKVIIIINE